MQVAAQGNGLIQRPAAIGVQRHTSLREARGQGADRLDFGFAMQHTALEFEIVEAITRMRGLGLADDGFRSQRGLVAHALPGVIGIALVAVAEIGLVLVTDEEQITEHFHRIALLAFAEQCSHRHTEVLAEQVEQRRLQRGDGMDGDTQVEGLQAATAGITISEGAAHLIEQRIVVADRLADEDRAGVFEGLANALAAGDFADTDVAGAVLENEDVAGEIRAVGTAQIEQHAVLTGDRYDLQLGDQRSADSGRNL